MSQELIPSFHDSSQLVLNVHAKSFSWASVFLPRENLKVIAELYHFCRYADNVADGLPPNQAAQKLGELRQLINGSHSLNREAQEMIDRLKMAGVKTEWMIELISGVESDLEIPAKWEEEDLLVYCYRVAGVVGLMMCPLIEVSERKAYAFAIDLGIAMQLTNIARDVAEDAARGRVYLPDSWLLAEGIQREDVLSGRLSISARARLSERLLTMSELYYHSGRLGLPYIPMKTRLAIAVAGRIYRAIGEELKKQGGDPWRGRARTSRWSKIQLTLSEIVGQLGSICLPSRQSSHERQLHQKLIGLPEVST